MTEGDRSKYDSIGELVTLPSGKTTTSFDNIALSKQPSTRFQNRNSRCATEGQAPFAVLSGILVRQWRGCSSSSCIGETNLHILCAGVQYREMEIGTGANEVAIGSRCDISYAVYRLASGAYFKYSSGGEKGTCSCQQCNIEGARQYH